MPALGATGGSEHGCEPVPLDEDVVVEKAKVGGGGFLGGEVVVMGIAPRPVVEEELVWRAEVGLEGVPCTGGTAIVHQDDFVGDFPAEGLLQKFEAAGGQPKLFEGGDEDAGFRWWRGHGGALGKVAPG